MQVYLYSGPVMRFGRCVNEKWTSTTSAVSEEKAYSNLKYQYNRQHKKALNTKISLPGKLITI